MKSSIRRIPARAALLLAAAALSACKSVEVPKVPGVTPYRMVIQQGNFISQEMVSQLKPGMSKEQVRYVLGTPLVTDIFHADRWDYIFTIARPGTPAQRRPQVEVPRLDDHRAQARALWHRLGFAPWDDEERRRCTPQNGISDRAKE